MAGFVILYSCVLVVAAVLTAGAFKYDRNALTPITVRRDVEGSPHVHASLFAISPESLYAGEWPL